MLSLLSRIGKISTSSWTSSAEAIYGFILLKMELSVNSRPVALLLNIEFFAASIVLGLEFLHNKGIIHRDLKPENLVFDQKGYIRITDLGVARIWKPENACDTSGTPGYMAPEVMCRCNHGVATDYYALGIIIFECIYGIRPYIGSNRQEIRDKILAKQVQIKKKDIPPGWSIEAI